MGYEVRAMRERITYRAANLGPIDKCREPESV